MIWFFNQPASLSLTSMANLFLSVLVMLYSHEFNGKIKNSGLIPTPLNTSPIWRSSSKSFILLNNLETLAPLLGTPEQGKLGVITIPYPPSPNILLFSPPIIFLCFRLFRCLFVACFLFFLFFLLLCFLNFRVAIDNIFYILSIF